MKKRYGSKFKSQVALEAIRGDRTIAEIASEYNLHPNLVGLWKKKLLKEAAAPIKFIIGLFVGISFIILSKRLSSEKS